MGRRPRRQVFMPDHYVFPGGGVEPCDRWVRPATELRATVTARLARSATAARARSLAAAAVRETFEETGLALGLPAPAAAAAARPLRPEWRAFHATGLAPALDRLDYIYRAVTPPGLPRRFNARFFMAHADDAAGALGGNGELLDLGWVPLAEAIARCRSPTSPPSCWRRSRRCSRRRPTPTATGRCRSASASAGITSTATSNARSIAHGSGKFGCFRRAPATTLTVLA